MVMIGIDPHKRTHTAVAIDTAERVLGERLVRATATRCRSCWSGSSASAAVIGSGRSSPPEGSAICWPSSSPPPANVVDIPATLASRVRLLGTGRSDKNDPNDGRSVAIAALRAAELVPTRPIHRLSRRGNRTLNHVIHIAAVTQLRHRQSPGRAYYDPKRTQGLTGRAASAR